MKKKTFILTLMLMLCSLVFGQEFYFPEVVNNGEYTEPMALTAVISFDGVEQQTDKLELGVFCGDEIRGRIFTKKMYNRYYARVAVFGKRNDYFTFKVYDHNAGKEWNYGCTITIGDSELDYLSYDVDGYGSFANPCVIDFIAPNHWIPNEYGYNSSLFIQAVVKIDGEELSNPNLELGAFCNGECRGSVKTDFTYEYNGVKRYYARMNIYGNSGNVITFRLYDHSSGKELEFMDVNTIDYEADASIGTIISPFVVNFITSPYVAQIGETKYQSFDAALEAAQDGDDIILLTSISLTETAVLSKDINIALNNNTVTGTIELANAGATVTGAQNAVTSVITNIADYKVVYADDMYKVVAKVYVAQVGETKYETIQAAVNAATAGQTVTIIANVSGEAVEANKNITITDNGEFTLNNVSINAVEGTSALTVSNLSFTGNSWINSGAASELVVSGVTADVTPSNASVTNSRSAFISLGRSEQKTLELTVENSSIIARGGSDAILGWAAITEANLTGNTFGSASAYQTNSDCVKFMAIANNAVLNITNNNVYSNYNGIVFGQNTTRDNTYTANVSGNNFYGGADHIWIEVSGSNTCHATINATSTNKVNGNAFTANDIKTHPNITTWTSYGGVDVVFDSNNKIIGGTFKYIADSVIAEGYEKSANNDGTYSIVKSISGKIAYRAYINDTEAREAVQVDLTNIIAKQSVVVKLYDANGNVLTTTSLKAGAAEAANLTCNIVLQGTASGSWKTTINATLTVENIPAKIELWIDGTLKDTFENALGAGTNVDETAKYIALDCVYKEAKINNTYYATLQAAIAAAQTGETIVLLADVTLANAIDITGKTLDLNGNNLKGNVIGTIRTNGGLYTTAENFKMIGDGADYYKTSDATVVIANAAITIAEGTVELAQSWNTLENQTLTVAEGAAFVVPSSMTFELNGTAIVSGTLTVNGQIILANKNATLKAVDGLNVTTNIADYKVVYENSMYKVVAKVYVAQVGETKYESLEEAIAAVPANQTITVLKDITLAQTLTIAAEKNFTLDLNGKAINTGFQQNSTDKHIYAFDNKGSLTLANGTINARGIFNYGTLTVNANATINSIDANGGYGVGNYGTLNVYGTIATTTEDNDAPTTGNYDATPIVNEVGATINVYEGSKITNVSNFTYALINNGTALIKGGTITSAHTAVGNSGTMTIEGGSFVCNGSDGISSHALIAEAGTVTIKGGTFDGKDNNNGFNVYASEGAKVYISGGNFLSCYSGSLYGAGTIEVSGGKFFDAVPENRCAAGYIPTQFTDGTYGVKAGSYIAQIGTTKYETFDAAYTAAKTGDVVVLFRTVVITNSKPWINYSKKNITVKAEFGETAFRVQDGAYVWFGGMTIESNDYCIIVGASDSSSGATVELYGGTYYGATSAISVTKGDVKIMDGTFKVEPYEGSYEYTINCIDANYNNKTAKVAIQGGKFYNFNPMNNAAEGANTNFVVANHITVKDTDNYWTVVALPTTDKIVSSEDHTVTSNGYGPATVTVTGEVPCVANGQGIVSNWIGFRITKPEGVDANVARVFTPGSNGTYNEKTLASILDEGKDYASMWASIQYKREFDYKIDWNNDGIMDLVINIDATTATIKHNYVEVERVEPSYGQDGYILYRCGCGHEYKEILPAENVAQIGETKYTTLEAAVNAVQSGQTVTVLKDITLAETLTIAAEKNFTLDLNGKAINAGFQQNSTDKHIYAFDNKGSLTLANGTINARGIFNYGTLTVNATATINSIDANGGYGVDNYGTLNVYGTIATTNEDNDAPESGNYDATPINNRTNATVNVFEGSVIANVSNFTYGIENNGTLNITGGTISSKHSTIGNYGAMTVEGGTIICDGYEGVSSQVIVAWNGSTTNIKGGTFDGKDNNNGFNVDAEAGAKVYISGGNFLSCYSGSLYGAGTIEVSGGKFFDAVPENRCAEGYIPTQFTDGTYGVKVGSYIAQIGTTKYETFEAAYAAAQTDDVIELFRTVVLTSDSDYNKEVTVKAEFNETAFRVKANVSFNNMTIISDDYCVIVGAEDGAGKLTINGGTYKGETTAVSVTKGDVKIMGGTFEVEPYQGSYEYTINCIDANYNQTAKVSIQGGKFYNFNPMNNAAEGVGTNFVVANHITVKDTENYWTVVALPTTDKIVSSEDHTVTSNGYGPATVTVTGEVPCVANGQGIVSSWIGFRITKPEGVDANVARVFTPGSNGTYNEKTLASILDDGKDYASMWVSIQYKRVFDYKVDWNNDGIIDLVINIDATAATIKHNYVEVERVEPSYGQDGYIKYQCGCGHVYTETLPAEFAKIAETEVIYSTIEAAIAAAQSGQTIVVLANVETTNVAFALPANVTLDLNGKTVKADIIGTVKTNGGLWITSTGHKMLGKGADIYSTENATVVNSANEVNIVSGAITLAATEWWTLQDQNLTIAENATFTIPATSKFNVMNGTTVTVNGTAINDGTLVIYGTAIVNGTITVNGTVELATLTATLKAQAGLNVITNITDYKVVYADGMYKVVQAIYEQRRTLGAGWNWFSSYINISGEEGLQALEAALGTSGLQIKGQLGFVDYSTGWGWNGTLVSASVEEMFMIQTSKEVELVLTGELANPATPITLQKNWTYIGYPVSEPMNLEYALANITPNDGDIIKTHNGGVAQYNAEWNTWYSQSLTSMTPGMGYMYRNTSGTTKTLVYPTPNAQTRAEVRANVTTEDNHWAPNASAFANNMNIIAVLENNDMMGEFEVAAFVNGEVRGSARPTYVEPIDAYVLFMTIYGEEGEELTFKYYDIYSDEEHVISNTVAYSDDAVIGSISEPYMFFANTLGLGENAASTLSIYPNPTTTNAAISFETTFDMVEVFNSLGAKVAEYRNVDRIEGMEAAGVYVIRVTNDSTVQNCRLIVK